MNWVGFSATVMFCLTNVSGFGVAASLTSTGTQTDLTSHVLDVNIQASLVREFVRKLKKTRSFSDVAKQYSSTPMPIMFCFEGAERESISVGQQIPGTKGMSVEFRPERPEPKQIRSINATGVPLTAVLNSAFNGTNLSSRVLGERNIVQIQERELAESEQWPLNRQLAHEYNRDLTFFEAEEILTNVYGLDMPKLKGERVSVCKDCHEISVWKPTNEASTVRDLVLALLQIVAQKRVESNKWGSSVAFQLIPVGQIQGMYKWSVLSF